MYAALHGLFFTIILPLFFIGLVVGVGMIFIERILAKTTSGIARVLVSPLLLIRWIVYRFILLSRPPRRALAPSGPASSSESEPVPVVDARKANLTFQSVVGMDETKARLLEAGQSIVAKRAKGEEPRNGILVYGGPGTGKTMMAEALAGELKLPFIAANIGALASKWVNQSTEQLVALFADARKKAPCVLFLDEFDAIAPSRSGMSSTNAEEAKMVNALLTQLADIRSTGVVVVAATNYLDRCDEAAIREGRMDFKIEVPQPDFPARAYLLASTFKKNDMVVAAQAIERAAKRWDGFSAARIVAIADEAAKSSKKSGKTVDFNLLMESLRTVQGNAVRPPEGSLKLDDLVLDPEQKKEIRMIANRMRNIEQIEERGGTLPTGILFTGEPGVGKTTLARALAIEAQWAFLSATGAEILGDKDFFPNLVQKAKDLRPAVVFLDEADDILANRRISGVSFSTNTVLTLMDGASGKSSDVIFVAATNNPDAIDEAAMRRFTEKLDFELPQESEVTEFARRWITRAKATFTSDATPQWLGEKLAGVSLANVGAILQQAVNRAVSDPDRADMNVNRADLETAMRTVLR